MRIRVLIELPNYRTWAQVHSLAAVVQEALKLKQPDAQVVGYDRDPTELRELR